MPHKKALILALISSFCLTACGGKVGRMLGMNSQSPDEFSVVKRRPLSMPPEYQTLPQPQAQGSLQAIETQKDAKNALFGKGATGSQTAQGTANTSPDAGLLGSVTKTEAIDPNIRSKVNKETNVYIKNDQTLARKILFWKTAPKPGVVIAPKAEAKRIKRNKAQGKAITSGDSPMIKPGR